MTSDIESPASDAVFNASHPSPEDGGPCATCAFRPGTEASQSQHTVALARLCVEGGRYFHCHEQPQLCRGFVAAVNLRGVPETEDGRRWMDVCRDAADILGDCIAAAKADEEAGK